MSYKTKNNKNKKISFVVGQLGAGGLERQLLLLLNELKKDNIEVNCIVWNYNEEDFYTKQYDTLLKNDLIKLNPTDSSYKKTIQLKKYVKLFKPNIIISFSTFNNFSVWISTIFTKTVAIGSIRTSGSRLLNSINIKLLLNLTFPLRLLVNSKRAINELEEVFFFKHFKKIGHLQNHLDLELYKEANKKSLKNIFSVSVGNFTESKRVDRFVDLFVELKSRGIEVTHEHIGEGSLRSLVDKKRIEEKVDNFLFFLGHKKDIKKNISKADVFIHLSEYEGSPNAVMEALACGLPVISTNCGDVKELIVEDKSGFVFNDFDVVAIADKYIELLNDKKKIEEMSKYAIESVKRLDLKFLKESFYSSLENINIPYVND